MTDWTRFEQGGVVGFGVRAGADIEVHEGDMFAGATSTGRVVSAAEVKTLPPAPAGKMLALWNNSRAMAEKLDQAPPAEPLYFIKANGSYLGDGGVIRKPPGYDGKVIFEGEIGIVIGRTACRISEAEAPVAIFGYTCVNDVTAVGILGRDPAFPQWTRAKSFDTFGVFGPVVTTGLDPATLSVRTVLDDQERQHYGVDDLFFPPARIVSAISQDLTLHPGDVICCGTSVGVGSMKPGSTVAVTIDGIGTLTNRYEADPVD